MRLAAAGFRACVAGTLLLAATVTWESHRRASGGPLNLVVITLDTTRADRLSPYGNMDISLPHLERLASEGIIFDRATSVGALTLPAHASLFTGMLPPVHGVRDNADPPLRAAHTTLAEILAGRGYRTGAFVGSVVLDRERGLAQGFEWYGEIPAEETGSRRLQRRADAVVADATRWLDGVGDAPFFMWAHLYDPHHPYQPPAPFDSLADPYIGEIAFADSQIGVLLEQLDRKDLSDRTVVIVAGDHGESLGEHGEDEHGIFIYEAVLRIPLIIRAPHLAPRRVTELVRLIDVMPTALELLDVPTAIGGGVSLVGLMHGTATLDLEAYAESTYPRRFGWSPLHAARERRFKYIEAPRPELYDLELDPFEHRNIVDERPALAAAMRARLVAVRGAQSHRRAPVAPEVRERLAALGYVSSAVPGGGGLDAPDPKDCIASSRPRSGSARAESGRCRERR